MSETTLSVPGIHCGHCAAAIQEEVTRVEGVETIEVDVDSKIVTVRGRALVDSDLRGAISEAGYEAA